MAPFDVYRAKHPWHGCLDARWWVLIEVSPRGFRCFPCSGQDYGDSCFEVRDDDPDFKATGFTKTSYIHDEYKIEVLGNEFLERRGQLEGDLLRRFRDSAGV